MAKGKNLNPAEAYRKAQKKKAIKKNKADRQSAREAAEASATKTAEANAARRDEERRQHREDARSSAGSKDLFGKDGRLLEPERSVYYDPILNPFGAPPPGMPMRLKDEAGPSGASTEEESEDSDDDDDEDIVMPEGPAPPRPPSPAAEDSDSDDSDDIPLPPGPPPPKIPTGPRSVLPRRPPGQPQRLAPFPRPPPPQNQHAIPSRPNFQTLPPGFDPRTSGHPLPPLPPFAPPHVADARGPVAPPLPAAPPAPAPGAVTARASAVISSGPQLRDLKKEATAFVPAAIRKKQRDQGRRTELAGIGAVDIAPRSHSADVDVDGEAMPEDAGSAAPRANLMDTLRSGGVFDATTSSRQSTNQGDDEYARFVASVGDML